MAVYSGILQEESRVQYKRNNSVLDYQKEEKNQRHRTSALPHLDHLDAWIASFGYDLDHVTHLAWWYSSLFALQFHHVLTCLFVYVDNIIVVSCFGDR
jgi:hypothetical protein